MEISLTQIGKLTIQPLKEEDYHEVVEVINASDRHFVGHDITTVAEFANDIKTFDMDPVLSTCVVRNIKGKIIGYGDYWPGVVPHVRMFGFVRIHPDHKGEGAGSALTGWMETRALERMVNSPPDLKVTLGHRAYANQKNAFEFLQSCGYLHVRSTYRMTIDLDGEIPEPVIPDGLELRAIQYNEETLRKALQAQQEAFLDHYGIIPEPFEDYYQRELNHILNNEAYDLNACYIILDGEEVAAVEINQVSSAGSTESGWVGALSVRRPWRNKGLGLALLRTAFKEMRSRGRKNVGLYVDAESLTGALRLYKKAGMYIQHESREFEKTLREGIDLANKG